MKRRPICLRGVKVHNLKAIDLDLPLGQLTVVCGLSGSGKTSLALDTLYAEGQRRYIESFSAYTRQFLERLDKPSAERIDGIPPAIAVTHKNASRSGRSTVGTVTEISDYLRLLLARIGSVSCRKCGREVQRENAETASQQLGELPEKTRLMIAYSDLAVSGESIAQRCQRLRKDGAVRLVLGSRMFNIADAEPGQWTDETVFVVIDRLIIGQTSQRRLRDSLEMAVTQGRGTWYVFVESTDGSVGQPSRGATERIKTERIKTPHHGTSYRIDGREWLRRSFSTKLNCVDCDEHYPDLDPRLLSFNSPMGACPECEGFGDVIDIDMDLVVPDRNKTVREGAIAPWNTPAYAHELEELLALADDYGIPVDLPFCELRQDQLRLIQDGVPEREFGGLRGFFSWLERRKYKMPLRVFLSRWRSYRPCPACAQGRLRPEALAVKLAGKNMAEMGSMKLKDALEFIRSLPLSERQRAVGRTMLEQILSRLETLTQVGLSYLVLDRTLRTLSRGEMQRVALTSALGSNLAGMLYVLDEPSVGLHPSDVERLTRALRQLRNRGNTVVVVDHEESIIRAADHVVEMGPGAGERGGQVVFQGTVAKMLQTSQSPTGEWLTGRRGSGQAFKRRPTDQGWIRLTGAQGNNLKDVTVQLPLGLLCLVTGVSGSGKSTLIQDTLVPALAKRMRKETTKPCPYEDVFGDGQIDDLVMIDQRPIGRSSRSNPVTYIKAFDEIRAVFSQTVEARTNNFGPSHFSFNVEGGRCENCRGDGHIAIDMQFLADVYMRCRQCRGQRYRREILEVKYRSRNIAEVLQMTVREAFHFFRGHKKVQARLKRLLDVGLDYVQLGQPANTLSGGEAQRLKLAGYLSSVRRGRTLFVLDEPTTGLHFSDVVQLLDCFDSLVDVGHSLIVVEHNLQMMKAADYIVDLGPAPADQGGRVVAQGTPEEVAQHPDSVTGQCLAAALNGS